MDHNEEHYVKFLRRLYYWKLYMCYCCCRKMIVQQLNELELDIEINRLSKEVNNDNDNEDGQKHVNKHENTISTKWETRNISIQDHKIKAIGNELSIDTTIVEEK